MSSGASSAAHPGALRCRAGSAYDRRPGRGGPGRWYFAGEVEVSLGPTQVPRPDVCGWRRKRLPAIAEEFPIAVRPDWICEILLVKGDRNEQVGGTYGLTAGSHHIACGAQAVGAGGTIYLQAGAEIVIEAPDITLKAPGGFIRLDGSGVTIQGSLVKINCGDSPPDFPGGGGGNPEKPTEAKVTRPPDPQVDDVSKTGLGPGR